MNVWLIQIGEALPIRPGIRKLRTAYIADELNRRGHSVTWWASAFDHFKKKWIYDDQTEVKLNDQLVLKVLKGFGYKKNVSISRFIDHRILAKKFVQNVTSMPKPDIIVASMPSYDLSYEAVLFANKNRIPILVDIRDQWPDIFLEKMPFIPKPLMRLILHNDFRMLRETMKRATGILSMMGILLDWGLEYAERAKAWRDKVFYLGYSRQSSSSHKISLIDKIFDEVKDKFIITFIGTFAKYHNPMSFVECAKQLKNEKNIHFILAGDGHLMPQIRKKTSLLPNITLTGWIDQTEITDLLKRSHVGVCTTNQKAFFFPNKSFAYLSEGLPVISGFQGDLKDIIEDKKIGFYYPPKDVETLSTCILNLYNDASLYRKMSNNATVVFNEMFEAKTIYENYANHIELVYQDFRKAQSE